MPDEVEPFSVRNTVHGDVHGDNVQIGYIGGDFTLHQHAKHRPPAELPLKIGVVPPLAASFQRRSVSLSGHTTVFTGMGGVGKTQLAADLCERTWAAGVVKLQIWVTASSREAIVSAYAEAAAELTGRDDLGVEKGARRLLEWLARAEQAWTVVLDDVQDPADLDGLWPPADGNGKALVTTRRRDAALLGDGRQIVAVDAFSEDEGLAYLQTVLGGQPPLLNGAADVVRALGSLPLALAQAGAYMLDRHLSCAEYLAKLRFRKGDADEHRAAVAATWALSLEQAELLRPRKVARTLLDLASVLSPNGIPLDLFTGPYARMYLAAMTAYQLDEAGVRDVLAGLHRLSLITLGGGEVRMHALVQQANRDTWNTKQQKKTIRAAADALLEAWPHVSDDRNDEWCNVLRANAKTLMAVEGTYLSGRDPHLLPVTYGNSLSVNGLAVEALDHFDHVYQAAVQAHGPHDFFALSALSNRAQARRKAGDLGGAHADYEHLLANQHRVRRGDRALMLTTMLVARHDHANVLAEAGHLESAIAELEEVLGVYLRIHGPESPEALSVQHDIALYRSELGHSGESLAELEQLLAVQLRLYGPDDVRTLAARHNLACARAEAGDLARATAELEQLVADSTRALGPDHPKTLTARSVLCDTRGMAGDPRRAVAEFERLLADRLRVFGPDHPQVQATREGIAFWGSKIR
ncbi:tetratricopeptide repeat protein [Lentzea kentuckyensis]|uniref:tetratricopeptide repeat protein n=1 Tax=Lentzea kentuckyensis TaxID=360086 RepID=UPI000A374869|nr:tetratricopeptide repeat protein [Lentzea kentuckyensis]